MTKPYTTFLRSSADIHIEEENSETEVDPNEEKSDLTAAASKDTSGSRERRKARGKPRKKRKGNKLSKKS